MTWQRAALLAITTAVAVAAAVWLWNAAATRPGGREVLAAVVGDQLPFRARISGGFVPANVRSTRAAGAQADALSPDARIALAELEKSAADATSPSHVADLGIAHLIHGDTDRAIVLLQDAAIESSSPLYWSDLAAAFLVKADQNDRRRVEFLARGYDAAAQSLKLGATPEALFNRTLALEGLAPYVAETAPWSEYARGEPNPLWIDAAKRFLDNQRPLEDASTRWDVRQQELRPRLDGLDAEFVRDTVEEFPEASREFLEREVIVSWSNARVRGDLDAMKSNLDRAELLALALHQTTGDGMPRDEVRALRRSTTAVARAHLAYAEGTALYESNKYPQARTALDVAVNAFGASDNPYRYWALMRRAVVDFQLRDVVAADRALVTVEAFARAREYRTLLGWSLWVRGLIDLQQWRYSEAISAFQEAAAEIEKTRQREFAVSLYHLIANNLRTLGEQQQSWEYIGKTLEGLVLVRKPTRRYISFYNANLFATSQGLNEAALVFQNAAVREATKAASEVRIDATTQRAGVHIRRGDLAAAARDLEAAEALLQPVPDGSLKQYLQADVDVFYGQLLTLEKPNEAARRVRNAISYFDTLEPARIPGLYLNLARGLLANDDSAAAAAALSAGIERLEQQQAGLGNEALKISYFDESWALFDEMVALQLTALRDADAAFGFAERSRARSLLATSEGTSAPRIRSLQALRDALEPNIQLVYYYVLRDKLLMWLIDRQRTQLIEQPIDARRFTRAAAKFRDGATQGDIRRATNDELYRLLWQPVVRAGVKNKTIVIVGGGELQQMPFAVLRAPDTGRYVVEDFTVVLSPSASFYVAAVGRAKERAGDISSALLVGNPVRPGSGTLPAAEREVLEAAGLYPNREVLVGPSATKAAFVARAPRFDVIHFGGHALVNAEYPLMSRLMFAPDGDADALFAHEISQLRFPQTQLVILAACSTARGAVSRGEGALNVARPFLAGGVPVVIASQWDVDDAATAELFVAFHREFAATKDAALALRNAQLRLLRAPEAVNSSPASWGAFVALGATTH